MTDPVIGGQVAVDPALVGMVSDSRLNGAILTVEPIGVELGAAQGIAGPQGRPGPAFTGFGSVAFTQSPSAPALVMAAGVRTPLVFAADPGQADDTMMPPFAGHLFWDGSVIVGRALNDVIEFLVNLLVVSQVAGGKVSLDVDVGSSLGPIVTVKDFLFKPAGETERVSLERKIRTKSGFLANGGSLYLTSTVPISVTRASVVIYPDSAGQP